MCESKMLYGDSLFCEPRLREKIQYDGKSPSQVRGLHKAACGEGRRAAGCQGWCSHAVACLCCRLVLEFSTSVPFPLFYLKLP